MRALPIIHVRETNRPKLIMGAPENNQYICPEGEALKQFRRNYSDPNRGPSGVPSSETHLPSLPIKDEVLPKCRSPQDHSRRTRRCRQVARDIAKPKQYKVSMKLRKKG